jgi:hypothetical protein
MRRFAWLWVAGFRPAYLAQPSKRPRICYLAAPALRNISNGTPVG